MQFFTACVLAIIVAFAAGQDSSCPGGAKQGQEVESGAYYYTCTDGKLVPAGCIGDSKNHVPIGGTFNSKNVQKTCVNDNNRLTVKCTACITDDGKVVMPGSNSDTATLSLTCVPNGDSVDLQVTGCIIGGKSIKIGEKTTDGGKVVMCQKLSSKDAKPVVAGCVAKSGQSFDIGTQFEDDQAFYHCKKDGETTKAEAVGCINEGKKVYDLDLFQKGDNFYRCRAGDTTVSADLWGCALKKEDGTIEPKSIACTWDRETSNPLITYVNCCIKKGDTATITQLYCLYTYQGGKIQVNEGCFRKFDTKAAGCKRQSDGSLHMDIWDFSDANNALASGLHQC